MYTGKRTLDADRLETHSKDDRSKQLNIEVETGFRLRPVHRMCRFVLPVKESFYSDFVGEFASLHVRPERSAGFVKHK